MVLSEECFLLHIHSRGSFTRGSWASVKPHLTKNFIFKGFVLIVLRLYDPVNPVGSMSSAVSLPKHTFTGQA